LKKNERAAFLQLMVSKTCNGELSGQEREELDKWRAQSPENDADFLREVELCGSWMRLVELGPDSTDREWKEFIRRKNYFVPLKQPKIIYIGYRAAACFTVFMTIITVYYLLFRNERNSGSNKPAYIKVDGMHFNGPENKVMLQLTDGSRVSFDTIFHNTLPNQGGCRLLLSDSTITYVQDSTPVQQVKLFNSVSTSYGKKYKVVLPDGSKVWLNATSSIHFPVSNYSQKRTVELTGEAYFEIKSMYADKTKTPFIVYVNSPTGLKQEVTVTGTAFNINAYGDEPVIKTNLLEGKVTVASEGNTTALQPGDELQLSKDKRIILSHVSMEEAMAWKKDSFIFINKPAGIVLKEITRWYGQSIKLKGDSVITIRVPRSTDLSVLEKTIDFQVKSLNGKKIYK
jgi:ferric-dicitrate binding protein FerR (iron transport regulator)